MIDTEKLVVWIQENKEYMNGSTYIETIDIVLAILNGKFNCDKK